MTPHQAAAYVRQRYAVHPHPVGMGLFVRPSTTVLRRALRDRATPKAVKGHVYAWLRVRRARSRYRRHPHAA